MLGNEVSVYTLNNTVASAAINLREAFDKIETIAKWLENHPNDGGNDPLVNQFGYSADEAYVLRVYFETLNTVRINNEATFELGRKMTGLA